MHRGKETTYKYGCPIILGGVREMASHLRSKEPWFYSPSISAQHFVLCGVVDGASMVTKQSICIISRQCQMRCQRQPCSRMKERGRAAVGIPSRTLVRAQGRELRMHGRKQRKMNAKIGTDHAQ